MAIQLGAIPSTAAQLVDEQGRATRPLQALFTAIRSAFAAVPSSSGQGDIWRNRRVRVAEIFAAGGQSIGMPLIIPSSTPTPSSASYYASLARGRFTTAAGAGSAAGYNGALSSLYYWLGNAAGLGGFRVEIRFGIDTKVATTRVGFGLAAGALTLNANDPSATLNCILCGADSADTTLQVMSNDAAGVATKVNLGANYPIVNNAVYRVVFETVANSQIVTYTVTREDTIVAPVTGTISADLPSNTTFLGVVAYVGNGATAAAASMGLVRVLAEETVPQ